MVRTTLTEPKTALAGVMLEISFARFMASVAAFKDVRTPSRLLRDFRSIVRAQDGAIKRRGGLAVGGNGNLDKDGRPFY